MPRMPWRLKRLAKAAIVLAASFSCLVVFGAPSPTPLPSVLVDLARSTSGPMTGSDFFSRLTQTFLAFGGMSWAMRVSSITLLVVATMKVTKLDDLLWSKLRGLQAFAAPLLSLAGGISVLAAQGQLSWQAVWLYLGAGAGAIALHELLDAVKAIPGLGSGYVTVIAAVEKALGGNPKPNPSPSEVAKGVAPVLPAG